MKFRHLDIEALRALVAIADLVSFSQAASQLGRTQSAISLQIKRLEEMLGQSLLLRTQGRVQGPTAEGLALITYARQMLRLNDEAYHCVGRDRTAGTLRIGLPEELMESVFPAAMARFHSACPEMRLCLRSDTSASLLKGLEAGELDTVLFKHCGRPPASSERSIWREPLVWMAGEAYAHELASPLPLALFGENCAFRLAATQALAGIGQRWVLAYSGSSTTGLRFAVSAGLGITVLPRSFRCPGLRVIDQGLPPLPNAEIGVRHAPGSVHPAAERFVNLIGEEVRRERS